MAKKTQTVYVKDLMIEHASLIAKIDALEDYMTAQENDDDKIEYANKAIQLAAMKKYAECLEARMNNTGTVFNGNEYFEKIGELHKVDISIDVKEKEDEKVYNDEGKQE